LIERFVLGLMKVNSRGWDERKQAYLGSTCGLGDAGKLILLTYFKVSAIHVLDILDSILDTLQLFLALP